MSEDYAREHAARVAAEAEADGLRRDLAAVSRARDVALADVALWRSLAERRGAEVATLSAGRDKVMDALVGAAEDVAAERDLYRAALADAARGEAARCDTHYGGTLATQVHEDGDGACDACAKGDGWTDTPHAAAIRGALKATEGER